VHLLGMDTTSHIEPTDRPTLAPVEQVISLSDLRRQGRGPRGFPEVRDPGRSGVAGNPARERTGTGCLRGVTNG
jgi:hypothetical protein